MTSECGSIRNSKEDSGAYDWLYEQIDCKNAPSCGMTEPTPYQARVQSNIREKSIGFL